MDDFVEQSIRNEIPGTVKEIISDKVLSEIIVETRIGEIASVITTRSVQDMGLKVGDFCSRRLRNLSHLVTASVTTRACGCRWLVAFLETKSVPRREE